MFQTNASCTHVLQKRILTLQMPFVDNIYSFKTDSDRYCTVSGHGLCVYVKKCILKFAFQHSNPNLFLVIFPNQDCSLFAG